MRKDITSAEFISQRAAELLEEIVTSEREILIEKLSIQYSYLKSEYTKVENAKLKLE